MLHFDPPALDLDRIGQIWPEIRYARMMRIHIRAYLGMLHVSQEEDAKTSKY